jgi:Double zinc ribbon
MRCAACGFENASGMKFCGECGASLKLKCASCGFENAPKIKFCGECGKPLAATASVPTEREPRSYTPKHLAEKILTSRRQRFPGGTFDRSRLFETEVPRWDRGRYLARPSTRGEARIGA